MSDDQDQTGLPPYGKLLGLSVERDASGAPVLAMPFGEDLVGRPGYLQGGAIAGLLEMAAIVALRHALDGDGAGGGGGTARIKPITVTVDYMRGGLDRLTHAAGTVTRLGGRAANVEATAWQDDPNRPIASARMNYLIVRN